MNNQEWPTNGKSAYWLATGRDTSGSALLTCERAPLLLLCRKYDGRWTAPKGLSAGHTRSLTHSDEKHPHAINCQKADKHRSDQKPFSPTLVFRLGDLLNSAEPRFLAFGALAAFLPAGLADRRSLELKKIAEGQVLVAVWASSRLSPLVVSVVATGAPVAAIGVLESFLSVQVDAAHAAQLCGTHRCDG